MFRVKKAAPRQNPREYFIRKAKKSKAGKDALNKLNDYLNANTAEPMYWLHNMFQNQQNAITYKELREAIINGYMDEKTLQAWQQDYANFVSVHLAPLWQQAATAGAAAMSAAADWVFDAMGNGITSWISDHGAEWITVISDDSRAAIQSMIGAAASGQYTVDELSRTIRPLIGLTKPQAEANLKYYTIVRDNLLANNPGMKKATAEKAAHDAALKYAARQQRYRAYTIATTETAYAYNFGFTEYVRQAQAAGYMGDGYLAVDTAADDAVCPICAAMEGQHIPLDQSFQGKALFAGQKNIPPFHPRCRCATHFEETAPPVFQPTQAAQTAQNGLQPWGGVNTQGSAQNAVTATTGTSQALIPASIQTPSGMTYNKNLSIGNTGTMQSWIDADGQEWYFKPAEAKFSHTAEPFRAYVQEASYKVQSIIDPDSAVEVGVGDLGGKFGAFQKKVDISPGGIDLEAWQTGAATDLGADVTAQIQREHVTDWLMGNFDAHGENFVTDTTDRIIGLDKEQSFRYIKDTKSATMSYTYHPNASYNETEPLYNTMYRRFAKGEIDLDLQDTLTYIKRVESIPDAEYREIFRDYAESLHGKGQAAEDLLDVIVERKSSLRETYRQFYSELLTERTGKTVNFVWADEATAVVKQPLAAVQQTIQSVQGMNIADLKAIAKNKGIAYYNNMNKTQLVTAITDPTKAAEMSNQVKTRLAANAAARKAAQTAPASAMPKGVEAAGDVFKDLSKLPISKSGIPVASDKGSVEGLALTGRRMNIDGTEYYEISGKLTQGTWSSTWNAIKGSSNVVPMDFEEADQALALFSQNTIGLQSRGVALKARKVTDGQNTFELYVHNGSEEFRSWQGFFRARVPVSADGAIDAAEMSRVLKSVGLDDLLTTPTAEAERTLIKSRLVWQNAPGRVSEFSGLTGQALDDKLDDILRDIGISDSRIAGVELRKVAEGYATYYDPEMAKAMKKAGAEYVWSGVRSSDSVVGIVKTGGLQSTNARSRSGIRLTGSSPAEDMRSGGADSVFTRIGVKSANKTPYGHCYCGGPYRIIIDEAELGRTDWYAYDFDNFGRTTASEMSGRMAGTDFAAAMKQHYATGNEIMFRQGIPASSFTGIICETQAAKAELIQKFKLSHISEINGIPLDKFIKVGKTI